MKVWCVNFDLEPVLRYGLTQDFWLMQYQYSHDGYGFQGHPNQKAATTKIWKRLREIQPGDWLVAYLKPNRLYAIGEVVEPRKRDRHSGVSIHHDNVARTVREHEHKFLDDGIVRYADAPAFYEDFTDDWKCSQVTLRPGIRQPKAWLYPQRIDVREWQFVVPNGVVVDGLNDVPVHQKTQAAFQIDESFFQRIKARLAGTSKEPSQPNVAAPIKLAGFSDETADDNFIPQDGDERKRIERQIRERRGQRPFRDALRKRYGDHCLVTGCKVLAVLEAAHIKPYRREDDNHPENGLLLRADIHTLFDLDLLGIEPQSLRIELHPDLAESAAYKHLTSKTLRCPDKRRPSIDALKLRYKLFQERFDS